MYNNNDSIFNLFLFKNSITEYNKYQIIYYMEVLPHFWIQYYNENLIIIKQKNIKNIIHLSKYEPFIKNNIEEIRIPIEYENENLEEQNNIMFQYLFDITDYIHDKIMNNQNILLLGYKDKQDIDTIVVAYYIRYGKLSIHDAILFLKSKKDNIFNPKCLFYFSLNKFHSKIFST